MRLEEIMTSRVVTINPDETAKVAWSRMQRERIRHLVVLDRGRLVGVLSERDLGGPGGRAAASRPPCGRTHDAAGRITPALGRERLRMPNSSRRAPMAAEVARAAKVQSNRVGVANIPAFIRSLDTDIDEADRDYLRRKLGGKLGKFSRFIERTSVRIEDVNGPRGGIDKRCRIKVVLKGSPSVVVEQQHHNLQAVMDSALERTERAVRRNVQRRRAKRSDRWTALPA